MLKTLTHLSGPPRNLATGILMAELLASLTRPIPTLHYITIYHTEHKAFLTWPALVSKSGTNRLVDVKLGPKARKALDDLIQAKIVERTTRNMGEKA